MTSSARSRPACEVVRPSALAVLRLIISSNRVGCWTGRSADLAPRETDQLNPLPVNRQPGVWFDPQAEDGRRLRGQFRRASLGPSQQHRADSCRARFTAPAFKKGEINARVACRACPSHTLDPPGRRPPATVAVHCRFWSWRRHPSPWGDVPSASAGIPNCCRRARSTNFLRPRGTSPIEVIASAKSPSNIMLKPVSWARAIVIGEFQCFLE